MKKLVEGSGVAVSLHLSDCSDFSPSSEPTEWPGVVLLSEWLLWGKKRWRTLKKQSFVSAVIGKLDNKQPLTEEF